MGCYFKIWFLTFCNKSLLANSHKADKNSFNNRKNILLSTKDWPILCILKILKLSHILSVSISVFDEIFYMLFTAEGLINLNANAFMP